MTRWHRLLGDDVRFVTGTDEYGLKNQQAAEALGLDPQTLADTNSARFREAADLLDVSYDDFIRTTEPRHTRSVQKFLQAVFDNGDIERGTYEGLYCVSCEAYYTEDDLVDGNCPIHGRPVERVKEENWFFRLSRYQQRLLDWYEAHPDAIVPASRRNEVLSLHPLRPARHLHQPQLLPVGRPPALGPGRRWPGCGSTPSPTTSPPPATAPTTRPSSSTGGRSTSTSSARTSSASTPSTGRRCCMAAGLEPPRQVAAHGWLLLSGEKISKTKLNQISPGEVVDEYGVDPVRYHLLRETPFGLDGDFSGEGLVARYNSDLANNLGNLLSRVATVVRQQVRRDRARAPGRAARWRAAADATYKDVAAAWDRLAPSEALEATWRLIRETNAHLEAAEPWKAEPGPEVDAVLGDALEALRIVTVLVSPAIPAASAEIWRRLGLPGSPADQRLPGGGGVGRVPGRAAGREGRPALPPPQVAPAADVVRQPLPPAVRGRARPTPSTGPRRPASAGWCASAPTPSSRRPPSPSPGATRTGCGRRSASTPTTPSTARRHRPPARRPRGGGGGRVRARLPLRPLPPRRAAGGLRGPDRPGRRHGAWPWSSTPGRRGTTPSPSSRPGPPCPTVFHCFSGGPAEARRALDLGAWLSFSGIVTFKTAGDLRAAAALAPLDRILVETDAPYLTPVPHRGRPNEPAFVPLVGAAVADRAGRARGGHRGGHLGKRGGRLRSSTAQSELATAKTTP